MKAEHHVGHAGNAEKGAKAGENYLPLIMVLFFILFLAVLVQALGGIFSLSLSMRLFMGFFFLLFGAFKVIDWKGFADMYAEYDIVAKRWRFYAYLYPLMEITLGFLYLTNTQLRLALIATLVLMVVGSIGVVQALSAKKKIHCACLGAVVKLPMTKVTLIEDLGMGLMALIMLILL